MPSKANAGYCYSILNGNKMFCSKFTFVPVKNTPDKTQVSPDNPEDVTGKDNGKASSFIVIVNAVRTFLRQNRMEHEEQFGKT